MRKTISMLSAAASVLALSGCGNVQEILLDAARASAKESLEQAVDDAVDEVVDEVFDELLDFEGILGGDELADE